MNSLTLPLTGACGGEQPAEKDGRLEVGGGRGEGGGGRGEGGGTEGEPEWDGRWETERDWESK